MNREKQVLESRRLIEEGLVRAVRTKGYAAVSVSDIAVEAGVSRTTFYRHFAAKRDVLLSLFGRISGEVLDEAASAGQPDFRTLVRRRFAFVAEHPELPALLSEPEVRVLFHELRRQVSNRVVRAVGTQPSPDSQAAFAREFYLGGTDAVTDAWIRGGMIESVDEMTAIVVGLIGRT